MILFPNARNSIAQFCFLRTSICEVWAINDLSSFHSRLIWAKEWKHLLTTKLRYTEHVQLEDYLLTC